MCLQGASSEHVRTNSLKNGTVKLILQLYTLSTIVYSSYSCTLLQKHSKIKESSLFYSCTFFLQLYTLAKIFYCCTLLQKHPKKEQTSYHSCTILQKHSTIVHSCKKFFFCTLLQKHEKKKKNGTVKNIPISTRKKPWKTKKLLLSHRPFFLLDISKNKILYTGKGSPSFFRLSDCSLMKIYTNMFWHSEYERLTFTTLWANSADDKLAIFFLFFLLAWTVNPIFWEK